MFAKKMKRLQELENQWLAMEQQLDEANTGLLDSSMDAEPTPGEAQYFTSHGKP